MTNKPRFDTDVPEHVMAIALLLDGILNTGRKDMRFALLVWQDSQDDIQGLVSNASDDQIVVGMLELAKSKINDADGADGIMAHTYGHA